jgi:hypothetical protein
MAEQPPGSQANTAGQSSARQRDELLTRLIARHLPPDPRSAQLIAVYERVFSTLWSQLAVLMGHGGAQSIFARAVQLASRQTELAAHMHPTATALDFTALHTVASRSEAAQLHAGLAALAVAVEQLIGSLLGPGLSHSLLRDVELALSRQSQISHGASPAADSPGEEGSQK